jgi:hypothetical protein
MKKDIFTKYSFVWATAVLFILSLAAHWGFAWYAFVDEQKEHGQTPKVEQYLVEVSRDTFENWQSEFLQLMWQVAGLAFLYYVGSSQSKEGDERKEEKLDAILRALDKKKGDKLIAELDKKYPKQ